MPICGSRSVGKVLLQSKSHEVHFLFFISLTAHIVAMTVFDIRKHITTFSIVFVHLTELSSSEGGSHHSEQLNLSLYSRMITRILKPLPPALIYDFKVFTSTFRAVIATYQLSDNRLPLQPANISGIVVLQFNRFTINN
jgi:hypothetical protein